MSNEHDWLSKCVKEIDVTDVGEKDDQRDHRKQKCDHQMCQEECQWIYQLGAIPKSDHVCPGSQSHLLSLSDTK